MWARDLHQAHEDLKSRIELLRAETAYESRQMLYDAAEQVPPPIVARDLGATKRASKAVLGKTGKPRPAFTEQPFYNPLFQPLRPNHVRLHYITGVFQRLGYGMKSGGFTIMLPNGTTRGFTSTAGALKFNGVVTDCSVLFKLPQSPGYYERGCPRNLIPGKTTVLVAYWRTRNPFGVMLDASDEIDYRPAHGANEIWTTPEPIFLL